MGIAKKLFLMVGHPSIPGPIDASIIATLGPILVLVISVMFLVDRFTPMKVLGMALGLAGALVVILSGSGMQAPSDKLGGDAVVLLAIVASSFSMVWLKELIMRYKPVTLLRWIYPVAAVMMLPIGLGRCCVPISPPSRLMSRGSWPMLPSYLRSGRITS